MKKLQLIAGVLLIAAGLFAQTTNTATQSIKANAKYCCPKCDFCSTQPGNCETHKTALVKEGMFYCPMHQDVTSEKAGKCPKCNMDLVKMDMTSQVMYCCAKCDWSVSPVKGNCPHITEAVTKEGTLYCVHTCDKAGKCPKCGSELQKIEIRKKKKS